MRLHHVAYVTRNLEQKAAQMTILLGCKAAGPIVVDEFQGVRILFMEMKDGSLLVSDDFASAVYRISYIGK